MARIDSSFRTIAGLTLSIALLSGCEVDVKSTANIRSACELLRGMDLEEEICAGDKPCVRHGLVCEQTSYASQASPHTRKDWRGDYKGYFRPSGHRERVNAAFEEYKKWGIGEERFFIISDNADAPAKSSRSLYFYLNANNMPRIVGATLFDADSGEVSEYEFEYDEIRSYESHMSTMRKSRVLVTERTFTVTPGE